MKKPVLIRSLVISALAVAMVLLFSYEGTIPPLVVAGLCLLGLAVVYAVWKF